MSRKTWREIRRVLWNLQLIFALGQKKLSQCAFYRGVIEWKHGNIVSLFSVHQSVCVCVCMHVSMYVCLTLSFSVSVPLSLSLSVCLSLLLIFLFPSSLFLPPLKKQENNKLTEIKSMFSIRTLSVDIQQISQCIWT